MNNSSFNRRRFLVAALSLSGIAATISGPAILGFNKVLAFGDTPPAADHGSHGAPALSP